MDNHLIKIITATAVIGCLTTAALILWTVYLYSDCSIISFIANER